MVAKTVVVGSRLSRSGMRVVEPQPRVVVVIVVVTKVGTAIASVDRGCQKGSERRDAES